MRFEAKLMNLRNMLILQQHDAAPGEVEQVVQRHQIAAEDDERRGDDTEIHQVQHCQKQQRLMRRLAPGGLSPDRAGGAGEEGKEFEGGGECGHGSLKINQLTI